jgi:hypothetical protein
MNKKYIVRLTDEERALCEATIKKETAKSQKLRRATILLKADADGPAWEDAKVSEAVGCRTPASAVRSPTGPVGGCRVGVEKIAKRRRRREAIFERFGLQPRAAAPAGDAATRCGIAPSSLRNRTAACLPAVQGRRRSLEPWAVGLSPNRSRSTSSRVGRPRSCSS